MPKGAGADGMAESGTREASEGQPTAVTAYDVLWTYRQGRGKGKRRNLWDGTAVVAEPDGRR